MFEEIRYISVRLPSKRNGGGERGGGGRGITLVCDLLPELIFRPVMRMFVTIFGPTWLSTTTISSIENNVCKLCYPQLAELFLVGNNTIIIQSSKEKKEKMNKKN